MKDEELAEIEARAANASPGPWRSMRDGNQYTGTSYMPTATLVGASRVDGVVRPWNPHAYVAFGFQAKDFEVARFLDADADFVAHARADVPAILAEVRRLQAEVAFRCEQEDLWMERFNNAEAERLELRAKLENWDGVDETIKLREEVSRLMAEPTRTFEGWVAGNEYEFYDHDPAADDDEDGNMPWTNSFYLDWLRGLEGKHVRLTVTVLP